MVQGQPFMVIFILDVFDGINTTNLIGQLALSKNVECEPQLMWLWSDGGSDGPMGCGLNSLQLEDSLQTNI
jgi:hypothetical protein